MDMDVNDIKVMINSGFRYLMKTCYQWGKDHPLVSGVLLFFYLLYIFLPYIFSVLFYSFPLVLCTAILLGGPRIRHPKNTKKEDDPSQMIKRTFGKEKIEDKDHIESFPRKNDPNMPISSGLEENILPTKKMSQENSIMDNVAPAEEIQMYATLPLTSSFENCISKKTRTVLIRGASSCSEIESDDEDEAQEEANMAIQWTEDDQRNLIELGSSEIERNKRLEILMAKRQARKILSMQPRRTPMECVGSYYPEDHYIDRVGPVMLPRRRINRNPFDIPYDTHEERPSLRGGSFEEEFFEELLKDMPFNNHDFVGANSNNYFGKFKEEEPLAKATRCGIPKPIPPDKQGFSRFKKESDVEDNINEDGKKEDKDCVGIKDKEENPASSSSSSNRSRKSLSVSSRESSKKKTRTKETSEAKSLTCVVPPKKNKFRHTGKEKLATSSSSSNAVSNPPSKMEERSYYTTRPHRHHRQSCSIASDMQVEVSEAESASAKLDQPIESLLYDADVDRDANSGDEDFWGTSPHPMRLGSFGAKSRLPDIVEDNNNSKVIEIADKKSTNGDVIESRASASSSSSQESIDSQMEGKSQHLEDYLAALHPNEVHSNTIQVPSTSNVGEGSAEEIRVKEDSNGIFEGDEDRGKSEVSKEQSRRLEAAEPKEKGVTEDKPKEVISDSLSSILHDDVGARSRAGEEPHVNLEKEVKNMSGNQTSIIHVVEPTVSDKGVTEVNPKKVISDSLSTTSHGDVGDQSRSGDEPHAKSEKEVKTLSENLVEGEVKQESPSVIHAREESNSETNNVVYDANTADVDRDTSKETKDSSLKIEDMNGTSK